MKDMTGWWGWRGKWGGQAADPGPASQAHAAPQGEDADLAELGAADGSVVDGDGAGDGGPGHGGAEAGPRRPAHRDGAMPVKEPERRWMAVVPSPRAA